MIAILQRIVLDVPLFLLMVSTNWMFRRWSLLGRAAFFEREQLPWIEALEARTPAIRRELDALLADREQIPNLQDISSDQRVLTKDDKWKAFFFFAYQNEITANCERCPETYAALREIPQLSTAMFSVLSPKKRIPRHHGPYAGMLRAHLGLKIPGRSDQLGLRVRDEVRVWEEGRTLIFDDGAYHSAWNDSDEERVVLLFDIPRPVGFPASAVGSLIQLMFKHSPFVQHAIGRLDAWNEALGARAEARSQPEAAITTAIGRAS